jgi:hypothetical protein
MSKKISKSELKMAVFLQREGDRLLQEALGNADEDECEMFSEAFGYARINLYY